jgi:hypothetical protein
MYECGRYSPLPYLSSLPSVSSPTTLTTLQKDTRLCSSLSTMESSKSTSPGMLHSTGVWQVISFTIRSFSTMNTLFFVPFLFILISFFSFSLASSSLLCSLCFRCPSFFLFAYNQFKMKMPYTSCCVLLACYLRVACVLLACYLRVACVLLACCLRVAVAA